jgi:hypothetical protein
VNAFTSVRPSRVARKSVGSLSPEILLSFDLDRAGASSKEEGRRYLQDSAELMQTARTNSVGFLLVFLELLEREPGSLGNLFLAQPKHHPPHSQSAADVPINWGGFSGILILLDRRLRRDVGDRYGAATQTRTLRQRNDQHQSMVLAHICEAGANAKRKPASC